jgi:hypothetical protein
MTSSFSWLAFSEDERRKVLDVVDLFGDRDTRDELGIGTVRDALADLFFPGISTIQTRARYFLFVPWMYLELERKKKASKEIQQLARWEETKLIEVLAETEGEKQGVIGFAARKALKRLPSNIYWQGLGAWRIRQFQGGQDAYHRSLDRYYALTRRRHESLDEHLADIPNVAANWHLTIPKAPTGFPANATFELTSSEGEYLRERILTSVPNSLLTFLLKEATLWDPDSVEYPWMHPAVSKLSARQRDQLQHAENFSLVMYGASLLYNLILAELADKGDTQKVYKDELNVWADEIKDRHSHLASWDRPAFWRLTRSINQRIPIPTERFVERWAAMALNGSGALATTMSQQGRTLIWEREIALKRDQARVKNRRALEQWGGNAGAYRLNYRWGKAQRILLDILQPLGGE